MLRAYRETWRATGPAGRRFLIGGAVYAVRLLMFSVAFPLYAKERGFDSGDIGWLVGGAALTLFVLGLPITMLGGRGHTRMLLALGPLLAIAGQVIVLLAPDRAFWPFFFGSLLSGTVSGVFWILGDPLLAATTPPAHRAHVFALKFSIVTGGMALGGGLGGWIPASLEALAGFGETRALAATLIVVAALDGVQSLTYWSMPVVAMPGSSTRMTGRAAIDRTVPATPWLLLGLLAVPEAGMALGHNSIRPFLPLFFKEEHGLSEGAIGTAMATLALAGGIGALFIPGAAGRLGNIRTIAVFRSIAAMMVALCFAGVGVAVVVGLLFVFYSLADGTEATFITEAIERVTENRRTAFSGLYAMVWSASSFCASVASGALQDRPGWGFGAAFGLGVVGYAFSIAWIAVVFPRLRSRAGPGVMVAPAVADSAP